ncbi:MAG: type 1 glutamine amidotransferase [Deltaproteobacteria bacterium]|nr:type 1 glutamine amidotransferase [Deltaproteobacteria bacterium]
MNIACILAEGFEDSELRIPLNRLTAAGHRVVIIGKQKGEELVGKRGKERVRADESIDAADPGDYQALLIPGGKSPEHLRADERFVRFVQRMDEEGKLVAAVCHGPQILLTAGLVRGRTMTAWKTVQVDLRQAGAHVVDREVVVDENLVTSRKPDDLEAFSREILNELSELAARR